ncbi:MAG: bifunctional methionine sulfoxide reductase B/A protein [Pseudomonadota bacterium]
MLDKLASLTPEVVNIVKHKHTEYPGSSCYHDHQAQGTYLCRRCGLALFRGADQFVSHCGWPSFDQAIADHVDNLPDNDGERVEIVCHRCGAHLGHVFYGEKLTEKNQRYCVNGLAIELIADIDVMDTTEAIYAGGCFWGMEYYFEQLDGVLKTEVGYTGGAVSNPNYKQVCCGKTGHFEAIRVLYDPKRMDYPALTRYFFEIHDPTQQDGQGPDLGTQYLSAIFYFDDEQKAIAAELIKQLEEKNYTIATQLLPVSIFWSAEAYHQHYYDKKQQQPYCHRYTKRFG